MWLWIAVGIVVVLGTLWFLGRGGLYRRLFSTEHLLEVSRGIAGLKARALEHAETDPEWPHGEDPRVLVSSAGLIVYYTIGRQDDQYVHHYSVRVRGGYTAHAVGRTYIALVARVLGVPLEAMALGRADSSVHHAEFLLDPASQAAFAARPVTVPAPEQLETWRGDLRQDHGFTRIELPPEG